MKIRNGFYFGIGVVLTVPLLYFIVDRAHFVLTAQQVLGTIEQIYTENDRCGGRRSKYNCTRFDALLRYEVDGSSYRITVDAGSVRGHDQPPTRADYSIGNREYVAYSPKRPRRAYRDSFWDIWAVPFITFFVQLFAFVSSFSEKKRK